MTQGMTQKSHSDVSIRFQETLARTISLTVTLTWCCRCDVRHLVEDDRENRFAAVQRRCPVVKAVANVEALFCSQSVGLALKVWVRTACCLPCVNTAYPILWKMFTRAGQRKRGYLRVYVNLTMNLAMNTPNPYVKLPEIVSLPRIKTGLHKK